MSRTTELSESRAFGRLVGEVAAKLVDATHAAHGRIGDQIDAHLPEVAKPWSRTIRSIRTGVYTATSSAARRLPAVAADVAELAGKDLFGLSRTRTGRTTVSALNGLWAIASDDYVPLVIGMAVRHDSADVPLDRESVAAAFPSAGPRIAVFVHGLTQNEDCWRPRKTEDGDAAVEAVDFGERLSADYGITPVYVRYNTGRRIADNGALLSELIEGLVDAWSVPVEEITLIGHSMGGLVSLAATDIGAPWTRLLRNVVTIGTPHHGAPLARMIRSSNTALVGIPIVGPFVDAVRPTALGADDLCEDPYLQRVRDSAAEQATVVAISGSRYGDRNWFARTFGDGLVPTTSAAAARAVEDNIVRHHVDSAGHLSMVRNPTVYRHIADLFADR